MTTRKNVLMLLLQEAKKQKLKWLVQQHGENLFPNDDEDPDDYDNWEFTNNISKTVDYVKNIYNEADIIFSDHTWARYIKQNKQHSEEDISDYVVCNWLDDFSNNLSKSHPC
tara:strand:- start:433 stop:768 length:336 start_codon:yes stop_codon:yes gene_type:complete